MTKTTREFSYRINPDIALTFQLRAPEEGPTKKLTLKPVRRAISEPVPEHTPEATPEKEPTRRLALRLAGRPTVEPITEPTFDSTADPSPDGSPKLTSTQPAPVPSAQAKRRPGRPRKVIIETEEDGTFQPPKPKRGPGRPKKVVAVPDSDVGHRKENQEHDSKVEADISGHVKETDSSFQAEGEDGYETDEAMSME